MNSLFYKVNVCISAFFMTAKVHPHAYPGQDSIKYTDCLKKQLHQLLSPLLSILLTVPLGPHPPSSSSSSSSQNQPSPFDIRSRAAEMLGKIARVYGKSYAGLIPREWKGRCVSISARGFSFSTPSGTRAICRLCSSRCRLHSSVFSMNLTEE